MTDDARTALIARLETEAAFAENTNFYIRAALLRQAIAALRTPVTDLRAWVQHNRRCEMCDPYLFREMMDNGGGLWRERRATDPKTICTCGLDAALSAHDHLRPSGESAD